MEIEFLTPKDAFLVALLHKKAFAGFFLTELGVSFYVYFISQYLAIIKRFE